MNTQNHTLASTGVHLLWEGQISQRQIFFNLAHPELSVAADIGMDGSMVTPNSVDKINEMQNDEIEINYEMI